MITTSGNHKQRIPILPYISDAIFTEARHVRHLLVPVALKPGAELPESILVSLDGAGIVVVVLAEEKSLVRAGRELDE